MKKNISLVVLSLLSFCTLASCAGTSNSSSKSDPITSPTASTPDSSNSSSTGGEKPSPFEITNLQRQGDLSLTVEMGAGNHIVNFAAPISYSYQESEDSIENAYELKILPTEATTEEGEKDIEAIKDNYAALGLIMRLVGELAECGSVDLAGAYYNDTSTTLTAETLTSEELSVNIIGSQLSFVNTSTSGKDTSLRSYADTTLPEIDMESLSALIATVGSLSELASTDLIALLTMLDGMFPDESTLRPILSLVGTVADLIGNGAAIDIETTADTADVSLYLNEDGISRVNDLLGSVLGSSASMISINGFSFDLSFVDTAEKNGLLTDLSLNIDALALGVIALPINLDLNLGTEETEIDENYFADQKFAIPEYQSINSAVDEFYVPIKGYIELPIPSLLSLIKLFTSSFQFGFNTANVSLLKETGDMLKEAVEQYPSLDDSVKKILGDYVTDKTIMTKYDAGLELVKKVISDYKSASNPAITEANIKTYFETLITYADWDKALQENDGQALLTSFEEFLNETLTTAEEKMKSLNTSLTEEVQNEDNILQAYITYKETDDKLMEIKEYYTGERLSAFTDYVNEKNLILASLSTYTSSALITKISPLKTYEELKTLSESEFYTAFFSDGSASVLNSSSVSTVKKILNAQADTLENTLLSSYKTSTTKNDFKTAYNEYKSAVTELRTLEKSFLNTSDIYTELNNFGSILNNSLPAA